MPSTESSYSDRQDALRDAIRCLEQEPDVAVLASKTNQLVSLLREKDFGTVGVAQDVGIRLFVLAMAQRCRVAEMYDFEHTECMEELERASHKPRADWAMQAQRGASNVIPLLRNLGQAIHDVVAEGEKPTEDAAVKLILRQATWITDTVFMKDDDVARLRALAQADLALMEIHVRETLSPTLRPLQP